MSNPNVVQVASWSFEEPAEQILSEQALMVRGQLPSERESVVRQAHEIANDMAAERAAREAEVTTGGMNRVMDWARKFRPGQWATAGATLVTPVTAPLVGGLIEAAPAAAATASQASCKQQLLHHFPEVVKKIPGTNYWGSGLVNPGKANQTGALMLQSDAVEPPCSTSHQLRGRAIVYISSNRGHDSSATYKIGELRYGNRGGKNQATMRQQPGTTEDDFKCPDSSVWVDLVSKVVYRKNSKTVGTSSKWEELPVLNHDGSKYHCK